MASDISDQHRVAAQGRVGCKRDGARPSPEIGVDDQDGCGPLAVAHMLAAVGDTNSYANGDDGDLETGEEAPAMDARSPRSKSNARKSSSSRWGGGGGSWRLIRRPQGTPRHDPKFCRSKYKKPRKIMALAGISASGSRFLTFLPPVST